MVVEDNPDTAMLISRALQSPGVDQQIESYQDGEQALSDLLPPDGTRVEKLPRLILLDLKLPKLSGVEVLKRLREDPRTRYVPVVIFSSSEQPADRKACYEHGANGYVRKPVDYGKFTEILQDVAAFWLAANLPAYEPDDPQ